MRVLSSSSPAVLLALGLALPGAAGCQPLHAHVPESFWKLARHDDAVFEDVAQARRCLCALRHHPPVAFYVARQLEQPLQQCPLVHAGE